MGTISYFGWIHRKIAQIGCNFPNIQLAIAKKENILWKYHAMFEYTK